MLDRGSSSFAIQGVGLGGSECEGLISVGAAPRSPNKKGDSIVWSGAQRAEAYATPGAGARSLVTRSRPAGPGKLELLGSPKSFLFLGSSGRPARLLAELWPGPPALTV